MTPVPAVDNVLFVYSYLPGWSAHGIAFLLSMSVAEMQEVLGLSFWKNYLQ